MAAKLWTGCLLALVCAAGIPRAASGDPIFSFGGACASDDTFTSDPREPVFLGWLGFRAPVSENASLFARAAYAGVTAPLSYRLLDETDFSLIDHAVWRATYLPVNFGLRASAGRVSRTQAFLEAGCSLSWARFERDVVVPYPYGGTRHDVQHSEHWLPGYEVGAGLHHALNATLGFEWGVRWSEWAAPPRNVATIGTDRGDLRRLAVVAGLTLTPSAHELLAFVR